MLESVGKALVSISREGAVRDWNPAAEHLFGFARDEALGRSLVELVVPEHHREAQLDEFAILLETGARRMVDRRVELDALHRDGREFAVELVISPMRLDGDILFKAFVQDITARRRAQHDVQRLAAVVEASEDAIMSSTPEGTIETWNSGAERLYGYSTEEIIGQSFTRLLPEGDFSAVMDLHERLLAGEPLHAIEMRHRRKDGSLVDVSTSISPLKDAAGRVFAVSSIARDITARKEAENELRRYNEQLGELALQDWLTGLHNSRGFDAALDAGLERARREDGVVAVVLLNLNGLKQLNQARGRVEGDRLLRGVASTLRASCRPSETAARIREDEFALVLPDTDRAGARRIAERISADVTSLDPALSLSFGVAAWPADGESRDLLLVRADMALHASKAPAESASGGGLTVSLQTRERIDRVLALARRQLGMDLTFLGEFRDGNEVFRAVDGDAASFGLEAGTELPLAGTYCQRMVTGRTGPAVPDSTAEPEVADLALTHEAGIGSYLGVPVRLGDERLYGALCGVSHAPRELSARDVELMRFLGELVAELLDQQQSEARRQRVQLQASGIHALVAALDARDHYTGEHSRTVVALSTAVAQRLGLREEELLEVEQVGVLHDVGKVGIPDQVLQKQGPLTHGEWELMRQHPAVGERIVAATESLAHLASAIRAEHERWDGKGYPDGLRGDEIPLTSRITLACDAYHAMTSNRPYRAAMTPAQARAELSANAGSHFDPDVVEALLETLDQAPPVDDRPAPARERRRSAIPPWRPTTEAGTGWALGELRCACAVCGSHVIAVISQASLSGRCGTCGSYKLEVVAH